MKPWEAQIPCKPKNRDVKRCYRVYKRIDPIWAGGKIVWLNNREKTLAMIKYPDRLFVEILEKDSLEEYKKYMYQTVD